MGHFPFIRRHHLYSIPGAAIQKRSIRSFADAFLAAYTEIGVNLNPAKWRMIFIGNPKHARLNRAVFDAGRRPRTTCAAIQSNCKDARFAFSSSFPISSGHRKVFFEDFNHALFQARCFSFSTVDSDTRPPISSFYTAPSLGTIEAFYMVA